MRKTDLTQDRLRQIVSYDPATGVFAWVEARGNQKAGARAGSVDPDDGYRYIKVDGDWYRAQTLAWFWVKGAWPTRYLRFMDGDGDNCAIENLAYGRWSGMNTDKAIRNAHGRHHRKVNPGSYRRSQLKRDFGISLEQYQDAFVAQGGVCACCLKPEIAERGGKRKWLAVDHDHTDNTFRGLLCSKCNQGIGMFKDNAEVIERAAIYLRAHATKPESNVIQLVGRNTA
jgi:hypothetical protein